MRYYPREKVTQYLRANLYIRSLNASKRCGLLEGTASLVARVIGGRNDQLIGDSGSGGRGLGAGVLPPDSGSGGLPSGFARGSGVVVP